MENSAGVIAERRRQEPAAAIQICAALSEIHLAPSLLGSFAKGRARPALYGTAEVHADILPAMYARRRESSSLLYSCLARCIDSRKISRNELRGCCWIMELEFSEQIVCTAEN